MMTFAEYNQTDSKDLQESDLLRKGGALVYARTAKKHGDDAEKFFSSAKRKIANASQESVDDRLDAIQGGLLDMCDGLISMREQNGAITGIVTIATISTERTNRQLTKTSKR